MSTHLANIESRHLNNRITDIMFALFVALTAIIAMSTISTAATVAANHVALR
ncbi:MAG TPA: hypothetical protein VK427_04310 [Kofleriaceae bacterium]|nr:hypothetical protein [Kofleriaceae bacterium]